MPRAKPPFKLADVKRAIAGARAAGMTIGEVVCEDGRVIVRSVEATRNDARNPHLGDSAAPVAREAADVIAARLARW